MIKTKKQMYLLIFSFVLVILLGTTTYAFFNYTRTGMQNIIKTGRISFNSTQGTAMNLDNLFPIDTGVSGIMNDATKVGTVTINVTGDTTYSDGIEYLVSAVNVSNTVGSGTNAKSLPISIDVSVTNNTNNDPATSLGTSDDDYFSHRGSDASTSIYKVLAGETISNDDQLLVGYIKSGATGIDGNIVIKAYIDKEKVGISDTYPSGEVSHTEGEEPNQVEVTDYINGTPASFGEGRTIFTTQEWNSLQQDGVSFQVKVEANEGTWVDEILSRNDMVNIKTAGSFTNDQKSSVDEIRFVKMSESSINNHNDAIDITDPNGEGLVKSWFDNSTDKTILYIASPGEIYFPVDSSYLLEKFTNVKDIVFDYVNTSQVEDMDYMFNNDAYLTNLDLSSFDTQNVSTMGWMFSGCSRLVNLNISGLGSDSLTNMSGICSTCYSLDNINMSNFNFGTISSYSIPSNIINASTINLENAKMDGFTTFSGMFSSNSKIKKVILKNVLATNVQSMKDMFKDCSNLEEVVFSGITLGSVTNMNQMFYNCSKLTTVDVNSLDTSTVENMSYMFYGCSSITNIDMSLLDTGSVLNASYMLQGCSSLETVNLNNFGNNNLSNTSSLLAYCTNLKEVYMSNFNFGVADYWGIYGLFTYTGKKEEIIDLSNAKMTNVADISGLFNGLDKLEVVDMSGIDISSVTNMNSLFYNNSSLTTIYVSNSFNTSSVTTSTDMFYGCTSLVGGSGTTYDEDNPKDKTYAHIDGGVSNPGYLTLKTN